MIYNITLNEVATIRASVQNAINERAIAETIAGSYTESKQALFETAAKLVARASAYELGYLSYFPFVLRDVFTRSKQGNTMFDTKTIDMVMYAAAALNGSVLPTMREGGNCKTEYLNYFVKAMQSTTHFKTICAQMGDGIRSRNASWHQDSRWGSACRGVLELFGIIGNVDDNGILIKSQRDRGSDIITITNQARYQRLLDASNMITSDTPYDTQGDANAGITIDGEIVPDSIVRALTHDTSDADARAVMRHAGTLVPTGWHYVATESDGIANADNALAMPSVPVTRLPVGKSGKRVTGKAK